MTYSVRRKPENTKEIQYSNRMAKLLTEDMGLNLEALGFHLVRNHPIIVSRRLEGSGNAIASGGKPEFASKRC